MAPLNLWLTDRSRHTTTLGHCWRDRYLSYHAGPHGYGWQQKAMGVPTTTGTLVHAPIAAVLKEVQRTDAIPSAAFIYHEAIKPALLEYVRIVEERGLANIVDEDALRIRTNEQLLLLEGLVWTWATVCLPTFHVEQRILHVEEEGLTVIGCTCGLGDGVGDPTDHDARECQGIGWMTREDCISESRTVAGAYTYDEFKTTGDASMNWEAQWYHQVQLMAGVLATEKRHGIQVSAARINALIKGRYDATWNPDTASKTGPKFQNSPLVYAWRRPAVPGMLEEDWQISSKYVDDKGKNRKLSNDYDRTCITEVPESWWKGVEDVQSLSDFWVRWIAPTGKLAGCFRQIGPIYRSQDKLDAFLRQHVGMERRIQEGLWALADQVAAGNDWGTPAFEAVLDAYFPQTRGEACQSFFGDTCPLLKLCDKHEGWQDPALMGYIMRRPHHEPELQQAISRGLLPPAKGAGEEGED